MVPAFLSATPPTILILIAGHADIGYFSCQLAKSKKLLALLFF